MFGGVSMSALQMSIQKAYTLPEKDQDALAQIIETFVGNLKNQQKTMSVSNVGMFDGKFNIIDDIDFCNDEIAEMFGVNK